MNKKNLVWPLCILACVFQQQCTSTGQNRNEGSGSLYISLEAGATSRLARVLLLSRLKLCPCTVVTALAHLCLFVYWFAGFSFARFCSYFSLCGFLLHFSWLGVRFPLPSVFLYIVLIYIFFIFYPFSVLYGFLLFLSCFFPFAQFCLQFPCFLISLGFILFLSLVFIFFSPLFSLFFWGFCSFLSVQ